MPTTPLTLAELAASLAAIGGFEARPHLAVAVSGGPDSMALVLLAERWARQQGGQATALIVDHGLRPESGAEAETVAQWLIGRGVAWHILRWEGGKPRSGIQEAARKARYHLLAEWCRRNGVLHLLTAHHREDQVETYLIRRRAGSGVDGLAAMSTLRELSGCRLVRPLLAVPKARLAALLAVEQQPCLHDPSNDNPAFERARVRTAIDADTIVSMQREPAAYGRQRIAREAALDRLLAAAVGLHPAGVAAVDAGAFAGAEPELAERLLARVAACIGAALYPPRRARVARLRIGLLAKPEQPRTLGGCRFVPWRGRILVLRELAAADPPARLEPGQELLWDRRFAVGSRPEDMPPLQIGYLGSGSAPPRRSAALLCGLPRLVYPVLPALRNDEGLVAVPHLRCRLAEPAMLPSICFRPVNPLTRASFTVV